MVLILLAAAPALSRGAERPNILYEIEYFDQHLGRMLALLEETGELDNTLILVTADNGMPFPRIKGQEYEYSNHLPLAIMWNDGIKGPGRTVDDFVSFIDVAPTLLDVAGADGARAGMQPIEGRSLRQIFASTAGGVVCADRDHVLIGKERHDVGRPHDWGYPIRGIVKGEHLYLRNHQGRLGQSDGFREAADRPVSGGAAGRTTIAAIGVQATWHAPHPGQLASATIG